MPDLRNNSRMSTPQLARYLVSSAIRSGLLHRCHREVCGGKRAMAHHDDYSKPLEVIIETNSSRC
jgi:hypothetical protein